MDPSRAKELELLAIDSAGRGDPYLMLTGHQPEVKRLSVRKVTKLHVAFVETNHKLNRRSGLVVGQPIGVDIKPALPHVLRDLEDKKKALQNLRLLEQKQALKLEISRAIDGIDKSVDFDTLSLLICTVLEHQVKILDEAIEFADLYKKLCAVLDNKCLNG